ncbi:MAG TPA: MBL fold metallo-hydrolase [Sandaracinaceae bacterium LLY-WYZ-13_1]|nr:MBL fold metallo-hydrolase [Sandaracinaceae bacterium LLY-WYZ-13_1]
MLQALGGKVRGARLERIQGSPHFDGRRFRNAVSTALGAPSPGVIWEYFAGGARRVPEEPLPVVHRPELRPPREPLEITWLGHSSVLIDLDGYRLLTDPVFGPRSGPVSWAGPKRFHPVPIAPESLPPLDAILVSHDHYDHLDYPTVRALAGREETTWITALGVGAHLEAWGVPADRIVELDWWDEHDLRGLRVAATPARHFQGRGPGASTATFWCGWAVVGPRHSVYFSGDTGPWDEGFAAIGERFGGFDLSMIEIGAWHPSWGTIHLGPENALRVHELVRAETLMPVHWGTFNLALHAWDQPIRHLLELAGRRGAHLLSPMMGDTVHREAGVAAYWRERRARAAEAPDPTVSRPIQPG